MNSEELPTDEAGRLRLLLRGADEERSRILEHVRKLEEGGADAETVVSLLEGIKLRQTEVLEALRNLEAVLIEPQNAQLQQRIFSELENIRATALEVHRAVSEPGKPDARELSSLNAAMQKNAAKLGRHLAGMQKAGKALAAQKAENKALTSELKKLNMRLARLDDVEILVRLQEARKKIRIKKLPQWALEKRAALEKNIEGIEDEMLELLIINSLRRVKMNMATLKKATGAGKEKLREKVDKLLAEGRLQQEKQGRYVLYSLA